MDISVVIPSYNSTRTIKKTIESIQMCSYIQPKEIIVVDSGADNAGELIKKHFPSIIYYYSKTRLYPARARNIGWQRANGEIIAFLDSDCLADKEWLLNISKAHKNSSAAAITGSFEMANPEDTWGFLIFCAELAGSLPGHHPGRCRLAPSGNTSYKIHALKKVGGFPENASYLEDTILAKKLIDKKELVEFSPQIKALHINREGYAAFKNAFHRSGYYSGIARKLFNLKGHKFAELPFLIPLLLPYRFLNIYKVNRKGKNPAQKRLVKLFPLVFWAMVIWTFSFWKGVKAAKKPEFHLSFKS